MGNGMTFSKEKFVLYVIMELYGPVNNIREAI